jgi:hypothetical protein
MLSDQETPNPEEKEETIESLFDEVVRELSEALPPSPDEEGIEMESDEIVIPSTTEEAEKDILDLLLDESMYTYQANIKAKKGQKLTKCEKDALHYEDVEKNWKPLGLVGLVQSESCLCGSNHSTFIGWYGILQHKNDISAKRIHKVDSITDPISYHTVPSRRHTIHLNVCVCGNCLDLDEASTTESLSWGLLTLKQEK